MRRDWTGGRSLCVFFLLPTYRPTCGNSIDFQLNVLPQSSEGLADPQARWQELSTLEASNSPRPASGLSPREGARLARRHHAALAPVAPRDPQLGGALEPGEARGAAPREPLGVDAARQLDHLDALDALRRVGRQLPALLDPPVFEKQTGRRCRRVAGSDGVTSLAPFPPRWWFGLA